MADSIQLTPDLPSVLQDAALRGILVPFIGGGVSALAGCPNWKQLAERALRHCVGKTPFTHAHLDQLKTLPPRTQLSIARGLAKDHNVSIDYARLLRSDDKKSDKGRRLYATLRHLSTRFVTTNYDTWLDAPRPEPFPAIDEVDSPPTSPSWEPHVVSAKSALTADALHRENVVVHLHGSVTDPDGMILTTSEYVQHYQNDRLGAENLVLTFLGNLFRDKHVLFLGYGLHELEILEYIILKSRETMDDRRVPRHYIVQGFFSHQQELRTHLAGYYRQSGVGLIAFRKDEKGRDQLLDVLDHFATQARAAPLMLADRLREMERWLDD